MFDIALAVREFTQCVNLRSVPCHFMSTKEELVKGVERLKGTAKGIDLASFIAEYRRLAKQARCVGIAVGRI